jgi:hypothetical protein
VRPTSLSMSPQIGIVRFSHGDLLNASMQIASLTLELQSRKAGGSSPQAKVWTDSCSGPALISLDRMNRTPPSDPPPSLVCCGGNA